jgi:cytochrome c553
MAGLTPLVLAGLLAAVPGASAAQTQTPGPTAAAGGEFAAAGVCARCHVGIVLEWGF